jgi:hypothetical protein
MNRYWIPLLCSCVLGLSGPSAAQDGCPDQGPFSTTGVIKDFFYFQQDWNMQVRDTACEIEFIHGTGRIPRSCGKGSHFTASGTAKFWGGTIHLLVDTITCP